MKRSDTTTFVDLPNPDSKKAYCRDCEDIAGQFNRLVPRIVKGVKDDKFKVCSYCGKLYPIMDVKYFTEYEPKGFISDNPFDNGSKIAIKSARRKSRHLIKNNPLPNEGIDIPKFAGKKDDYLDQAIMEEGAVINSIQDSWTEEE